MADRFIGIIGSGIMGAGIAQVVVCGADGGFSVELMDVDEATVKSAIEGISKRLARNVEKGRMTEDEAEAARKRLLIAKSPECFNDCDLIIEAIVEDLDIKTKVLNDIIPSLRDDCIIATNTSSLSVTKLGEAIDQSHRTLGMHFFNPAPIMKLCEVIAGDKTDPEIVNRVVEIASSWSKKVARAADVPGFIVNHVARPYYLEAFRILEDGYATPEIIDQTMKQLGGFRMGPLELTDLIGQDINTATTRSVWQQLGKPPLLAPCALQEEIVAAGNLGRKTGKGVYDHSGDSPISAINIQQKELQLSNSAQAALKDFIDRAISESIQQPTTNNQQLSKYIFARILSGLIVQASLALERGVATREDIDTALKFGVNYPKGPFEWLEQIGADTCARWLDELNQTMDDNRFAVPESFFKQQQAE